MMHLDDRDRAESSSGCTLDRLDCLLTELPQGAKAVAELGAIAEGLAFQPCSFKAWNLADRIYSALEAYQQRLYAKPPAGFPRSPTEEEQAQVCLSAWRALGRTYARWCLAQESPIEGRWLVGAIACLGQIIRLGGFYHCRLPEGLWLDLHALFQLAQQAKLAQARNRWSVLGQRVTTTPEREYLRGLLLGLADPYGLLPHEVILLDGLLDKWLVWVKIVDDPGEGWQLDGSRDMPACWRAARHGLRLDWTHLAALFARCRHLAAAQGRFKSHPSSDAPIPLGLLEYLEQHWFQPPLERERAPPVDCEWVIGLTEIFARLQGEATEAIAADIDADAEYVVVNARPESVQVGDLVGVFKAHQGDLIGLARIDRLEWAESRVLRAQLKVLPGGVFAVGVQPLDRARQPCAYQRGLLLVTDPDRLSLLLAEQPLPERLVVRLLHGGKLYPIRLDGCQHLARGIISCRCVSAASLVQK